MMQAGALFGKYAVAPVARLLCPVLEDPDRRIQDRLRDIDHEFQVPIDRDRCIFHVAPGSR
jgi:hypothetical protein